MMDEKAVLESALRLKARLEREAEAGGYHLNPDDEMVVSLMGGMVQNMERFGYMGCPCRLLEGDKFEDLDVICPCDYRDMDLFEYGACYCSLYVTRDVVDGKREVASIPERRLDKEERLELSRKRREDPEAAGLKAWRCKVCGYLCGREVPPDECPVCRARRDRFETFNYKA